MRRASLSNYRIRSAGLIVSSITSFPETNMNSSVNTDGASAGRRQEWMSVLARAGRQLDAYGSQLREPGYRLIRPPETGMVMVRGRMGASGAAFNLGEMTVTRCVVQLDN